MQESTLRVPPDKGLKFEPEPGERRENDEPTASELEQVAALLHGDEPAAEAPEKTPPEDTGNTDTGEPPEKAPEPPTTLEAIAEKIGVKVADLYALEIGQPGADGETVTLGELKDLAQNREGDKVERLRWEEQRAEQEKTLMRSNAELAELVSMLPKSAISNELLERIAQRRSDAQAAEERSLMRALPEWKDADLQTKERAEMSEHLAEYGFPPNFAEQLFHAPTLYYIRTAMRREQRIKQALADVKTAPKPGHKQKPAATDKPATKPVPKRRARGNSRDVVSQVAELITNG